MAVARKNGGNDLSWLERWHGELDAVSESKANCYCSKGVDSSLARQLLARRGAGSPVESGFAGFSPCDRHETSRKLRGSKCLPPTLPSFELRYRAMTGRFLGLSYNLNDNYDD